MNNNVYKVLTVLLSFLSLSLALKLNETLQYANRLEILNNDLKHQMEILLKNSASIETLEKAVKTDFFSTYSNFFLTIAVAGFLLYFFQTPFTLLKTIYFRNLIMSKLYLQSNLIDC